MELDHEFWISFVVADFVPFLCDDRQFFISTPSRENKFLAEDLFLKYYQNAIDEDCLAEEDIDKLLRKYKIWNDSKEADLKRLIKDAENLKVAMFESHMNMQAVREIKTTLSKTNDLITSFACEKNSFFQYSAKTIATYCKNHFALGCSIFVKKNKPYWKNPLKCWLKSDTVLGSAHQVLTKYMLSDSDYRELARGEAWRSIWTVRKNANLFGRSAVDLSSPQRHLIAWSNLYDSVYKSADVPPEHVINDDDMLDGWMIFQKRKREKEIAKQALQDKISPNIARHDEIFIMAGADEHSLVGKDSFDLIYDMNDTAGKVAFKKRMAQIQRDKIVDESSMLETQEQIRMQVARQRR